MNGQEYAYEQLKKYASDLTKIYKSERTKCQELEIAYKQLLEYANALSSIVQELKTGNRKLDEAYLDTIHKLVLAAEYKDSHTGEHITRMSQYSVLLAQKRGLADHEVKNILYAAPMHDIGKIGIPDKLIVKPGKLSYAEFEIMKKHTVIGAKILADSDAEVLAFAREIALSHHEQWNGKGYPLGLAGEKIPLSARIVAIADAFDALTSCRPYKEAYPVHMACRIIVEEKGMHFDPELVSLFVDNIDDFIQIRNAINIRRSNEEIKIHVSARDQTGGDKQSALKRTRDERTRGI